MFNAHHDEYGFQPIVVFDGEGRFITAVLRPAKRPSGKEIRAFLRRLTRAIHANWAKTSGTRHRIEDLDPRSVYASDSGRIVGLL